MKLGYYYHVPAWFDDDGSARIPSVVGQFIRAMTRTAGEPMTVFAHGISAPTEIEDLTIGRDEARWIDLGPRASAPSRLFRPGPAVQRFAAGTAGLDAVLVQGPTPLLPAFVEAASPRHVVLLIGGDYGSWVPQSHFPWWRNAAIRVLFAEYTRRQRRASRGRLVYVQNPTLEPTVDSDDVKTLAFSSVPRSAVDANGSEPDWEPGTGRTRPVRLLYSGRIVRDKGVLEAVRALAILRDRSYSATLDLIGWIEDGDPIGERIREAAAACGVDELVRFQGYVPAGAELMARYRDADIFVIATYWDSLPRSMQEAMAVGLPVIATPVGGIGYHLRDRETAMLVEPRDATAIADAVAALVDDAELRAAVARKGHEWARRNSIESDCETIVAELRRRVDG